MKITRKRVAIVGCGLVGATTAFSLETQGVCDEIMMIDINKERAIGEMRDLDDSIEYLDRNVKVTTGTYADCTDMDIIVITAGAPPKPGQTRLDTLEVGAKICESIVTYCINYQGKSKGRSCPELCELHTLLIFLHFFSSYLQGKI